jgi:hypothetical protein
MNDLLDKMLLIEQEIVEERGPLELFAFLDRGGFPRHWHLVISADWIGEEIMPVLAYFIGKLHAKLSKEELLQLSAVIPLRTSEEFVKRLRALVGNRTGLIELRDFVINDAEIPHAFIKILQHVGDRTPASVPVPG